jgi:hypothetical protein
MRGKRKVSQQPENGNTLKAMAALGIIAISIIAGFKYSGGMPRGL